MPYIRDTNIWKCTFIFFLTRPRYFRAREQDQNYLGILSRTQTVSTWFQFHQGCRDLLGPFEYQDHISRYGICINQIRRLWCRLIPILTWQRFYVELVLTMLYILPNTDNRQQGCINRCVSWHIISPPIVFTKLRLSFAWSRNWYIRSRSIINPSDNTLDSRDVILRLWRSMSCLLMLWLLKSPVHQQAWHWQCRTDTECVSMFKS